MPGSATAGLLDRSPLELAVRAALGFGLALWLVTLSGPALLEGLLGYYRQAVERLDDHYRVEFSLGHQTGHDRIGGDLVMLGRAAVARTFMIFTGDQTVTLAPGQVLTCSTATGVLMQPAVMVLGLLLAWPLSCRAEAAPRAILGAAALALWLLAGIPLSWQVYFEQIPLRAFAPDRFAWATLVDKFLLNGGSVVVGVLLAAAVLAASRAIAGRR